MVGTEDNARMGPRLVILDVDGVVFRDQLIIALAQRRGPWAAVCTVADSVLFNAGRMGLETFLERAYQRQRGVAWAGVWETYERMELRAGAAETIAALRSQGMRVVLLTAGVPDPIVKDLATRVGADEGLGMHVSTRDGMLTGAVSGVVATAGGKLQTAKELVAREGIDWADVVVVGDDINNLPLMRRAGMSIGFHPAFAVRQEADHVLDEDDLGAVARCAIGSEEAHDVCAEAAGRQLWYRELVRKAAHLTSVAVPFFAKRFPVLTSLLLIWSAGLYTVAEYCRVNGVPLPWVRGVGRMMIRRHERRHVALGPLTLALGVLVVLVCLPRHLAMACILIEGVGDSLAGVVGSRWGRLRWPYNRSKTVEGSLAFLAGAVGCAAIYVPLDCALVLGVTGMFFESLPLRDWDNFVTPVATGICGGVLIGMM